jgi:hypothetical protein
MRLLSGRSRGAAAPALPFGVLGSTNSSAADVFSARARLRGRVPVLALCVAGTVLAALLSVFGLSTWSHDAATTPLVASV